MEVVTGGVLAASGSEGGDHGGTQVNGLNRFVAGGIRKGDITLGIFDFINLRLHPYSTQG